MTLTSLLSIINKPERHGMNLIKLQIQKTIFSSVFILLLILAGTEIFLDLTGSNKALAASNLQAGPQEKTEIV